MKKYKLFSVLATAAAFTFSMSSCYDLDTVPMDKPSAATFFKTQTHADQAMAGLYSVMQQGHVFGYVFGLDCLGGIATGYDNPSYLEVMKGTYTGTTGYITNKWAQTYEGIARANNFLINVDGTDMTEELKAQYKAEARFMRGLFYWTLSRFFGGVPYYDETTNVVTDYGNMKKPRETEAKIIEYVLADLEEAINKLPDAWDAANYGRATKWAATALKGKILLFQKNYGDAADCFEAVVNSKKFALYSDYAGLFQQGGDASNEMIFAIQNLGGVGQNFGMPMAFHMGTRSTYGSCWNNVMASNTFVESYEWKDGRPFDWEEVIPGFTTSDAVKKATFWPTLNDKSTAVVAYPAAKEKLLEMYANRDPRMAASIILPYTTYLGWDGGKPFPKEYVVWDKQFATGNNMLVVNGGKTQYLWRKFVPEADDSGDGKTPINNREDTPINFPLIRYADVLLMLAECYNEDDATRSDAIALINQVRDRVGMPAINNGDAWMAATTKDEVFQRIKHERAVELAAEGHSFDDMRRWGLLETLNGRVERSLIGGLQFTRSVTSRDYLWPIPTAEIEKNPELTNNPEW